LTTHNSQLGRAVIRLAEISNQPGSRRHVDEDTRGLLLEVGSSRPAHVETALQMYCEHRIEIFLAHAMKDDIAQIARVIDHDVDSAEGRARGFDNCSSRIKARNVMPIGNRTPPGRQDLADDSFGGSLISRRARQCRSEVVYHHGGSGARQLQGDATANATACAGHDGHFSLQKLRRNGSCQRVHSSVPRTNPEVPPGKA
jgi:hypothetical protein